MIKILHLYHDLMNLYGDWANAEVLGLELKSRGFDSIIEKKSIGDSIDIGAYDFAYIGSGTERSLCACLHDIMKYKTSLAECIENGMTMLATGNSHEIFGSAIIDSDAKRHEALGLLNFETVQGSLRVTGDCVSKAAFLQEKLIGFINRASGGQNGDIDRPFVNELGPGANDKSTSEGIQYNNLIGTYMTGPVLVRNPPLLRYFADKLVKTRSAKLSEHYPTDGAYGVKEDAEGTNKHVFFEFQEKSYQKALKELLQRAEK